MKRILLLALAAATLALGWWLTREPAPSLTWRSAPLERRDNRSTISATATLTADPKVLVGTQVSGIVAEILVDYNDQVEAGQLLARIDPNLLQSDVAAAGARQAEQKAVRDRLKIEFERSAGLLSQGGSTAAEVDLARAELEAAEAQLRAAGVSMERARQNLSYASIFAPIRGTVIRRDVELGQTVNAGFSAPTLFELAGDLGRLVAIANVDESDIGQVKVGQKAELSVMAWPDRSFVGTVRQIRLASTLDQSVVTYPVVIDVENPDGALLPGMTSTVEVVVAEAPAVLCAPNAALRYSPDPDLPVRKGLPEASEAGKAGEGGKGGGPGRGKGRRRKASASNEGTVWALVEGQLEAHAVAVGLRGAECAEISGEGLSEGLELVLGVERSAAEGASPFAGGSSAPRRPGGF